MPEELKVKDMLRGCVAGRMQSVGFMQVIPLILEEDGLEDDRFSGPEDLSMGTHTYGTMEFKNPTDKVALIPAHSGYVVPERAQDHAMAHAGLVKEKASRDFNTAMCIQQSQGGTISSAKRHGNFLILPYALREKAHELRKQPQMNKLWENIHKFNNEYGLTNSPQGGHLELFLNSFRSQLDQFVAEFEIVPRQIGAIILVNGRVAGLERAPSCAFWKSIWKALIRECYGSYAMLVQRQAGEKPPAPKTRVPLNLKNVGNLDDLEEALDRAEADEKTRVRDIVNGFADAPFKQVAEDAVSDFKLVTLENEQFKGQTVMDGKKVCYLSLFTTQEWAKNGVWNEASSFKF